MSTLSSSFSSNLASPPFFLPTQLQNQDWQSLVAILPSTSESGGTTLTSFLGRGRKDVNDATNEEEEDIERITMMAFDPPRQKEEDQLNPEYQGVTMVGRKKLLQASVPTWTQLGADIDGEAAGDWSGWSISLSSDGSVLAVGAVQNDGNGNDSGHVRVYK